MSLRSAPASSRAAPRRYWASPNALFADAEAELAGLPDKERRAKPLRSLLNHREGLCVFVDNPQVPMDNNAGERAIRGPAIGRRLSFGSNSEVGAKFTATMYSVIGTLSMNGIDVPRWLEAWLKACAKNGGKPPDDLSPWLPWTMRSEQIASVSLPSFRAGCGGIDAFAGAFSFINSDQLIAFGRAVAQNAAGFAFELALETISPVIAETMAKLRALAQWVNSQNLNSCETAQALVGALWSKKRPGERRDLRRDRHRPGDIQRLCRRQAWLRRGRTPELDARQRLGRDGRPGAGQRQLRLEGDKGVFLPLGRHAACRVRHGGDGDADRDGPHLRR